MNRLDKVSDQVSDFVLLCVLSFHLGNILDFLFATSKSYLPGLWPWIFAKKWFPFDNSIV